MAFVVGCLLAFAFILNAEAQPLESSISRGSSLTPTSSNSSWLSSSGRYAFGFYKQANGYAVGIVLAGIPEKTVVWTANRDEPLVSNNATLRLTVEGISLQSTRGQSSVAAPTRSVFSASMLDSGNFVLYNSAQEIVWQSFDYPTDTLLPKQPLKAGGVLFSSKSKTDSSTGIFRLIMQKDGNLVQYPASAPINEHAYFATMTFGYNITLNLDPDGHLYLLDNTASNIMNITNGGISTDEEKFYHMRIDADGIFRLYSQSLKQNGIWSVEWSSSKNKCDPIGLCGSNSYCITMDHEAECNCLPGFEPVTPGNQNLGCGRILVADACNSENENITYTMEEVASTIWVNVPYMVWSLADKDDCRKACSEDCDCEAALFVDGSCQKQRLPLRCGRRSSTTNIVFIKVGMSKPPPTDNTFQNGSKRKFIVVVSFAAFGSILSVISVIMSWKHNVWGFDSMCRRAFHLWRKFYYYLMELYSTKKKKSMELVF